MLTATLVVLGCALIALALLDRPLRRLPLTPALLYLGVGWLVGVALKVAPTPQDLAHNAGDWAIVTELVLLVSLFAVGVRLRMPPSLAAWRVALLLAGPGMVAIVGAAAVLAHALLGLPWAAALLVGAVLAPTDPVLASDVQIRSAQDRDAVRLSLTAEGGLNDGTALPAVLLALGLLGLHELGPGWGRWWVADLLWAVGGGALLGGLLGFGLGRALRWAAQRGDTIARDELVYVAAVTLSFGLARAVEVSSFVVAFGVGVTLLQPLHAAGSSGNANELAERMSAFGARCERLVEAVLVLAIGLALGGLRPSWAEIAFALLLIAVARPLSVLAVVPKSTMPGSQRRLVAWFGIRGIGTLFYLLFALEHGLKGELADRLVTVTLVCVALSIALHGVSVTPMMDAYQRREKRHRR